MVSFIRRHLDPADRLGETLFGLIMALGFTGAVRLEREEADNRALFIGIFGCNLAWAIVDGVMYVIAGMIERGRRNRVRQEVLSAPSDAAALARVGDELDKRFDVFPDGPEREQVCRSMLNMLRGETQVPRHFHADDLMGGLAVALIILISTFPVVVPYLVVPNPNLAVRISHWIALTELFCLGAWWGRLVHLSAWRVAVGLTLVGAALVLVTILLGG